MVPGGLMNHTYLSFTLSLRAPAVITSIGGDPNSSRTLPFISGSALRGAVARALGDPGGDPSHEQAFRALVLDGSVRFLHAYPRAGGRRALPTPLSWRVEKDAVTGVDGEVRVLDLMALSDADEGDGGALVPVAEPFVSIGAARLLWVQPRRGSRVHQQRDRAHGRAWTEVRDGREEAHGTIFVYEFLEAGQEFDGLVLVDGQDETICAELAVKVKQALSGPLLVGRSRRGGYGGDAGIEWGTPRKREADGQGIVQADLRSGDRFRALLTSAYIGRDPATGQLDPSQLEAELLGALGGRARVVRRGWSFDLAGGFNRKWRLEIPQARACAAGSVLLLESTAAIPLADLLAVEHAGLGERRIEGFGRIVFLEAPAREVVLRPVPAGEVPSPDGEPTDFVRFAEGRILDRAASRVIAEEAARLAQSVHSVPSPSLLARLRQVLRAGPESALGTLCAWLGDDGPNRLRRPAMDSLDRSRIGEEGTRQRLSDWIREIAGSNESVESLLRLKALAQRSHVLSEESARSHLVTRSPWIRARLIDAVLAELARGQRAGREMP